MVAFSATLLNAQDSATLTTPEEILANSVEDEAGARAAFEAVLNNAEATDAEKTEAARLYMTLSTPAPGHAYDMSFLLDYNAVTAENQGKYTQANLAQTWHCDIPGVEFGSNSVLISFTNSGTQETYMRVAASALASEESYDKFAVYQNVELAAGSYKLSARAFVAGLASSATLSAGAIADSKAITGGGKLLDYSVDFNTKETGVVKLGFKRNSAPGKLTQIAFNDMYLYKVSNIVEINNESGELAAATDVNVILQREFQAGVYYPICLPFVVENWREVFADLLLWTNYDNGVCEFKTVAGANTQARKPYMVKFNDDVTAENYMRFNGVTIQKGNAGSWVKTVAEGEEAFPVKMQGNWAAMELPEKCYFFEDGQWVLANAGSRAAATLGAFSAYIDASSLETAPEKMSMKANNDVVTLIEVAEAPAAPAVVNVYNLQGMTVKTGVCEAEALEGLPNGLYIVNGKKIVK